MMHIPLRIVVLGLLLALSACACAPEQAASETAMAPASGKPAPRSVHGEYVEGELLVKFADGIGEQQVQDLAASMGGELKRRVFDDIFLIAYPQEESIEVMIQRFQSLPQVLWAEPNAIRRPYEGEPQQPAED